jgi:hypothetical protein
MQDITEQLANLEEDGKQYAHFLTHPENPEYYAVLVREKTPEYVQLWLQQSNLAAYTLALSVEMPDAAFTDYLSELFPGQLEIRGLKKLYHIENLDQKKAVQLATGFPAWKQEKIRLHRVKWLEQFPWVVSTQIG